MALVTSLLLIMCLMSAVHGQTCTAVANAINTYTCDYTTWPPGSPSIAIAFATPPQKIFVTNVNGTLEANTFSNAVTAVRAGTVSSMTEYAFIVDCLTPQGVLDISVANTFTGLEEVNELYIRYCRIGDLPASAFAALTNVTHIEFYKNVITTIQADAFAGLIFKDDLTSGNLTFDNTQLINGTLPDGLFSSIVNLRHLSLKNAGLTSFQKSLIAQVYTLSSIDISGNQISTLDSKVFDGIPITSFVAQANYWECTCDNVWIFNWATWNRVDMNAALTCETPAHWEDVRLYTYNVTVCAEKPGIDPLDIIIGTFLFIALALALAALGMSCVLKAHLSGKKKMTDGSMENLRRWSDDDEPLIDDLAPDSRPTSALSVDREDQKLALLMNLQKRPATGTRKEAHLRGPLEITTASEESEVPVENGVVGIGGSSAGTPVPPVET